MTEKYQVSLLNGKATHYLFESLSDAFATMKTFCLSENVLVLFDEMGDEVKFCETFTKFVDDGEEELFFWKKNGSVQCSIRRLSVIPNSNLCSVRPDLLLPALSRLGSLNPVQYYKDPDFDFVGKGSCFWNWVSKGKLTADQILSLKPYKVAWSVDQQSWNPISYP